MNGERQINDTVLNASEEKCQWLKWEIGFNDKNTPCKCNTVVSRRNMWL